jgi:hypothetical protein
MRYAVVIPTIGRARLADCLDALARARGEVPEEPGGSFRRLPVAVGDTATRPFSLVKGAMLR